MTTSTSRFILYMISLSLYLSRACQKDIGNFFLATQILHISSHDIFLPFYKTQIGNVFLSHASIHVLLHDNCTSKTELWMCLFHPIWWRIAFIFILRLALWWQMGPFLMCQRIRISCWMLPQSIISILWFCYYIVMVPRLFSQVKQFIM